MSRQSWLTIIIASFLFAGVGFAFGWFGHTIVAQGQINRAYVKGLEDADSANTYFYEHFQPAQTSGPVKMYIPKNQE